MAFVRPLRSGISVPVGKAGEGGGVGGFEPGAPGNLGGGGRVVRPEEAEGFLAMGFGRGGERGEAAEGAEGLGVDRHADAAAG